MIKLMRRSKQEQESKQNIDRGLCQCGCGGKTSVTFVRGHHRRNLGVFSLRWKAKTTILHLGYVGIKKPDHPRAHVHGYVFEHILVVEEVMGKPFPKNAVVHHHNEKSDDNTNSNLVACQDEPYHRFIHQRIRAFKACGHANWLWCSICKKHFPKEAFHLTNCGKYLHNH